MSALSFLETCCRFHDSLVVKLENSEISGIKHSSHVRNARANSSINILHLRLLSIRPNHRNNPSQVIWLRDESKRQLRHLTRHANHWSCIFRVWVDRVGWVLLVQLHPLLLLLLAFQQSSHDASAAAHVPQLLVAVRERPT